MGIATVAWCGWGQSYATGPVSVLLGLGSVVGLALAVGSVLVRRRLPGIGTHDAGPAWAGRVYRRALGAEILLIVVGNIILGRTGHPTYVIAWTYAVMAVHFLPLARLYRVRALVVAAGLGLTVAALGAAAYAISGTRPEPIVGGVGGLVLLATGLVTLVQSRSGDVGE
ncbi:MAG: hypothetical protein ACR2LI_09985 [Propionibacteriaceae bacterium]